MTKIADLDLLKLPNLNLRKIRASQSEGLGILNTIKCGIFSKNKNSGLVKWSKWQF